MKRQCPYCRKFTEFKTGKDSKIPKHFPFCSEKCRLLDLGSWLDAEYRVPAEPNANDQED